VHNYIYSTYARMRTRDGFYQVTGQSLCDLLVTTQYNIPKDTEAYVCR